MYDDLRLEPPLEGMTRVLAFTLVTALVSLGHVCPDKCAPQASTLKARMWFAEQAATAAGDGVHIVVIVRFGSDLRGGTSAPVKGLIERVNHCVQRAHLRQRTLSRYLGQRAHRRG